MSLHFGVEKNAKSFSGKCLQLMWSVFLLIIVATYTAHLAAAFSEKPFSRPLETIEDIPKSKHNVCAFWYMQRELRDVRNDVYLNLSEGRRIDFSTGFFGSENQVLARIEKQLNAGCIWLGFDT